MKLLLLLFAAACAPKPVVDPYDQALREAQALPPDPLASRPVLTATAPFVPHAPTVAALSNGVQLWTLTNSTLPLVAIEIRVPGGSAADPAGKEGTAALAARLMTQGSGSLSADAFQAAVDRLGATIESVVTPDDAVIRLSCMKEVLPQALDLVAGMILHPTFDAKIVARERALAISEIQESMDDPNYVSARTATSLYWGPTHPYGRPADGTVAGLKKTTAKDLVTWQRWAWSSKGGGVAVVGDVSADEAKTLLEARLGAAWKPRDRAPVAIPAAPEHPASPLYLVDVPGSAQTGFYLLFPGVKATDPTLIPTQAGTIVLGGTFTSRLNGLLREQKGYTYGVKAAASGQREAGVLSIRTRIRADVTAAALKDLLGELDRIRAGIDDGELQKAQAAYQQDVVEAMETREAAAASLARLQSIGQPADQLGKDISSMFAVRTTDVPPKMAAWDRSRGVFVLVGDKATVMPQLADLGPVEVVTAP